MEEKPIILMHKRKEGFLEGLKVLFDTEIQREQLLSQRVQEIQHADVEQFFWQHLSETQQQVQNLNRCFGVPGVSPQRIFRSEELGQIVQLQPPNRFLPE